MPRSVLGMILAGLLVASPLNAQDEHVLLVEAARCESIPESRAQTGFLLADLNGIITALHGVVGCDHITAQHSDGTLGPFTNLRIIRVDVERDIALLGKEELDFKGRGIRSSSQPLDSLSKAFVLGHPSLMSGLHKMELEIGTPSIRPLKDLVPENIFGKLYRRGSPSVDVEVISVNDDLQPGHSGAPLLDVSGRVLGVANGGLAGGTLGIGWAIPFADIRWTPPDERRLRELGEKSPEVVFSMKISGMPPPAPAPAPAAASRESRKAQIIDELGFRFSLSGCDRDGPSLRCEVLVTNREADRDLTLDSGRLIDEGGNDLAAVMVGFGPEIGYLRGKSRLASGVPVKAQIKFENVRLDIRRLALMEIELAPLGRAESRSRGAFGVPRVQFRSVEIYDQ